MDVDKVVAARVGRKKPPLKVLWARYLTSGQDVPGARFYGYDRFCEIVTEHVRTHDLTAAIAHVPGTMPVDWAGAWMQLTDPVAAGPQAVSVFVASLSTPGWCSRSAVWMKNRPGWMPTGGRSRISAASRW